jgi:hypothetical protein
MLEIERLCARAALAFGLTLLAPAGSASSPVSGSEVRASPASVVASRSHRARARSSLQPCLEEVADQLLGDVLADDHCRVAVLRAMRGAERATLVVD